MANRQRAKYMWKMYVLASSLVTSGESPLQDYPGFLRETLFKSVMVWFPPICFCLITHQIGLCTASFTNTRIPYEGAVFFVDGFWCTTLYSSTASYMGVECHNSCLFHTSTLADHPPIISLTSWAETSTIVPDRSGFTLWWGASSVSASGAITKFRIQSLETPLRLTHYTVRA